MKRKSILLLIAALFVSFVLTACGPEPNNPPDTDGLNGDNTNTGKLFTSKETIEMDDIEINKYILNDDTSYDLYTVLTTERPYNEYIDIGADIATIYPYGYERKDLSTNREAVAAEHMQDLVTSWREKGYVIDVGVPAISDNMRDYVIRDEKKRLGEVQMDKNGNRIAFSPTRYEMVPTKSWEDNRFELIEKAIKAGARDISMEEGGMFPGSGYSDAFKAAWQEYYNEPWKDPDSSMLARFQSETLKQYLVRNMYDNLAKRVTAKYPDSKYFYVNHSMFANTQFGASVDVYGTASLDSIYGTEGQVWSDTTRPDFVHRGEKKEWPFEYGYMQYSEFATYQRQFPDKPVRVVADPKADVLSLGWRYYQWLYEQNIVTQLLFPELIRYEINVWPERIFQEKYGDTAPLENKRIIQNIFKIQNEINKNKKVTVGSGSTGIAMAFSANSNAHQETTKQVVPQGAATLGVSLVEKGIPVQVYALESFKDKSSFEGIKTLIVSYDFMKPEDVKYNKAIADWVRDGGSLLFIGSKNTYTTIEGSWWDKEGNASAEEQLFKELGITVDGYGKTEIQPEFGDDAVKVNQKVGKGNVIVVEYNTMNICLDDKKTDKYLELVKKAHEAGGHRFITTEYMYSIRGDIEIYKALGNPLVVKGDFVDMLAQNQDVLTEKRVEPGEVAILRRYKKPENDTPRLIQSTGIIIDGSLSEEAAVTKFTTKAPKGSETVSIIYSNTLSPKTVTAKDAKGAEVKDVLWKWDEKYRFVRIKNPNDANGLTITVEWN